MTIPSTCSKRTRTSSSGTGFRWILAWGRTRSGNSNAQCRRRPALSDLGSSDRTPGGFPASDPIWYPFYQTSIDASIPVLIHAGLTGIGQGLPGGRGIKLDDGHPRHIDAVAARFPELKILAARPAFPWQDEMIAILLHKGNVHYELHGWSPKTFSPALKREIGGRLQDRIMFGCDYPVLKYEMMVERWRGLGFSETVLEKIFHRNAEAYFPGAKQS